MLKHILLIKIGNITINTFVPMRNKFIYFCSIKIWALGCDELLESIFCLLLVVEALFLQKVVEMLEEVAVDWLAVRWIWRMRQNFVVQFLQFLKRWFCDVWSGILWRRLGPFLLTDTGCRRCNFLINYTSSICQAYFSDIMISLGFRKL